MSSTAALPPPVSETLTWHPAAQLPEPSKLVLLWLPKTERNIMPHAASGYWDGFHKKWMTVGADAEPAEDYDTDPAEPTVSHWSLYPVGPDRGQAEPCD